MLAAERLAFIQASNEALYAHLDEALNRINKNLQGNKELADRISRSPRAIKTIQVLEAAIAMFEQNQPEYQTSEYAMVTDAGSEPQVCIQLKSRSCSTMKPKESTRKIKSWETKWHKFSNKTPTYRTKLPKNTKPLWRSSRRTQLWLWSPGRSPPICSLNTTAMEKLIPKQKTSPGENHSSKRRSESKSYSHRKRLNSKSESESRNENYCRYEWQNFKSENKNKNKDVKDVKV
jgi:hypothetical protein